MRTEELSPALVAFDDVDLGDVVVLCFPQAGGGASFFRSWADASPPGYSVVGVRMPGRESRIGDEPYVRVEPALTEIEAAVGEVVTSHPYVLFGHCGGAIVAFELARRVEAAGLPAPQRLVVSAQTAPHVDDARSEAHLLDRPKLKEHLAAIGGTPPAVLANDRFFSLIEPVVRADLEMIAEYRYTPGPRLSCPITVLAGDEDALDRASVLAWQEQTDAELTLRVFPGGHFFLTESVPEVMAAIAGRPAA